MGTKALSCIPKSVFLFGGAPKMCSSQNDGRFSKSDIANLGVLFVHELERGNFLFPLHDKHVYVQFWSNYSCMCFILLHTHLLSKYSYSKIKFRFDLIMFCFI